MAESRRLNQLIETIQDRVVWPRGPCWVALSGGADSAALAFLASTANEVEVLGCVHIHHGLKWSDRLAEAAGAISNSIGVPLQVAKVSVPSGPSPENQARGIRYKALEETVDPHHAVLLGHTRNDRAETVLLNLLRGSGGRGLAGIPFHRPPNVYRPLLDISRSETRELAYLAGLPFVDDPSNCDTQVTRNLLRLEVLPRLEEINPNLIESLARTADHLNTDSVYLDRQAEHIHIKVSEAMAEVPVGILETLAAPIRNRVVRNLVGCVRAGPGLSSDELERISAVVEGNRTATEISGAITVSRVGPMLRAQRRPGG